MLRQVADGVLIHPLLLEARPEEPPVCSPAAVSCSVVKARAPTQVRQVPLRRARPDIESVLSGFRRSVMSSARRDRRGTRPGVISSTPSEEWVLCHNA
jgi:hypothetical protein